MLQHPNSQATMRLFCFPYAGGGVSAFRLWEGDMLPGVELCLVQYPGRENRLHETPMTRLSELVETLVPLITPLLDRPFAFFGHSLGSFVAFELARELQRRAQLSPTCFFASGSRAPQLPTRKPPIYRLPREEFIAALSEFNGTPEVIRQNKELMELLLPMLRADMSMFDTYTYLPGPPLECPILAVGGLQDTIVMPEDLYGWREQTRSFFSVQMFPGDHFFLQSSWKALLEVISRTLASSSW